MDGLNLKNEVVPGDQLVMTAKFVKRRGTIAVEAKAEVVGSLLHQVLWLLLLEANVCENPSGDSRKDFL